MQKQKHRLFLLFLLFFINTKTYTLTSDENKPIQVLADSAKLSQSERQVIYTGHVQFIQGTTMISASKAITKFSIKNQLVTAIIQGSNNQQAHYTSEPKPRHDAIHAYADIIFYYPEKHLIQLKGKARIEQGKNSFSAASINYDTLKQAVLSQSDKETKTTLIIYPDKKFL